MDGLWARGSRVQSGYYNAVIHTLPVIEKQIEELIHLYPTSSLLFTGHSAGGAFSTLAMFLLSEPTRTLSKLGLTPMRMKLINFASPKVGDAAFASSFNNLMFNSSYRVVNSEDLVWQMPPDLEASGISKKKFILIQSLTRCLL